MCYFSSYLHCKWATLEELEKDPRIHQKIKRFRTKQAQMKHLFAEVTVNIIWRLIFSFESNDKCVFNNLFGSKKKKAITKAVLPIGNVNVMTSGVQYDEHIHQVLEVAIKVNRLTVTKATHWHRSIIWSYSISLKLLSLKQQDYGTTNII